MMTRGPVPYFEEFSRERRGGRPRCPLSLSSLFYLSLSLFVFSPTALVRGRRSHLADNSPAARLGKTRTAVTAGGEENDKKREDRRREGGHVGPARPSSPQPLIRRSSIDFVLT